MSLIIAISLLCGLCVVATLVWGSASIRSPFYLRSLCRAKVVERCCAITFDDGPDELQTPSVLDVLAKHGVKATFFLIGHKVLAHPEIVRRILSEGHTVANHTYNHSPFFALSRAVKVADQLSATTQAIEKISGLRARLFRLPFGIANPIIGAEVRRAGLISIGWSVRSFDTIASTPRDKVLRRILGRIHSGAVVLLHDRCCQSAELLDALLNELKARGYTIKSVEQLFEIQAYEK